jgi:hypothetical protein
VHVRNGVNVPKELCRKLSCFSTTCGFGIALILVCLPSFSLNLTKHPPSVI